MPRTPADRDACATWPAGLRTVLRTAGLGRHHKDTKAPSCPAVDGMADSTSRGVAVKRVHGGTIDREAWRVASSMDPVDWVQRKVTRSIRRWTQVGRSRNPGTGAVVGWRLTAERDRRKLAVFAMNPKTHSCRRLRERLARAARVQPGDSKTGGDQRGLNLRGATWSNDAENQLTTRWWGRRTWERW